MLLDATTESGRLFQVCITLLEKKYFRRLVDRVTSSPLASSGGHAPSPPLKSASERTIDNLVINRKIFSKSLGSTARQDAKAYVGLAAAAAVTVSSVCCLCV